MAFGVAKALSILLSLFLYTSTLALGHAPPPQAAHAPEPHKVHPPVKPPVKPPTAPPAKPPTHSTPPPVKPPTSPPVKPPSPPPVKPPTHPPVKPPASPPVKPPTPPPVKPPVHPPVRKEAAVGGVVYCKSCKYKGVDTLTGASPLKDAAVKLACKKKKLLTELRTTDKNGYFFFNPKWLTSNGVRQCKVYLVSSPSAKCNVTTNLNGGIDGAIFRHVKTKLPYQLFAVGPFAFDAPKKCY